MYFMQLVDCWVPAQLQTDALVSFIAKTAAAICDAVEARPGARGVALTRLHALLHYSLRHFEHVPEHLPAQFQSYLVAAPGADGPTSAEAFDAGPA